MIRLVRLLAPAYLGFALSAFANVSWDQWEFYAIIVPFYILVKATDFNKDDNE
jgi:hypothetical protein